ncbi:MAG: glutamate racemase [Bermanella sp.]
MTQTSPTVLVFDSGVGALSVGGEIHSRLPSHNLIYALDSAGFPYGEWPETALSAHICQTAERLVAHYQPDLLVVACNSASTTVLPTLRAALSIPVVGVVPAIKPAASQSQSKVIGLLATPGTVARSYTAQLIRDFAADCCVITVGDATLAPAVEQWFWTGELSAAVCNRVAQQFAHHARAADMDTLVLACTHFPLLAQKLAAHFPGLSLIDSGEAIARRVKQLLPAPEAGCAATGEQLAVIIGKRCASAVLEKNLAERGIKRTELFSAH